MKIEVTNDIENVRGTSSKTGKEFNFDKQVCYVHLTNEKYPRKFLIMVPEENGQRKPYKPGEYTLNEESFTVGRFNDLEIGRVKLDPVVAEVQTGRAASSRS